MTQELRYAIATLLLKTVARDGLPQRELDEALDKIEALVDPIGVPSWLRRVAASKPADVERTEQGTLAVPYQPVLQAAIEETYREGEARRKEAKRIKDERRITKMKAGLTKKQIAAEEHAALKAGKRWDPKTAKWVGGE